MIVFILLGLLYVAFIAFVVFVRKALKNHKSAIDVLVKERNSVLLNPKKTK